MKTATLFIHALSQAWALDIDSGEVEPGQKAQAVSRYVFQTEPHTPVRISFSGMSRLACASSDDVIELYCSGQAQGMNSQEWKNLSLEELADHHPITVVSDQRGQILVSVSLQTRTITWSDDAGEYSASFVMTFTAIPNRGEWLR